jgi:hypothetical protein
VGDVQRKAMFRCLESICKLREKHSYLLWISVNVKECSMQVQTESQLIIFGCILCSMPQIAIGQSGVKTNTRCSCSGTYSNSRFPSSKISAASSSETQSPAALQGSG